MVTAVTDMVCNVNSLLTLHSLDSDLSHHLSTLHHDYDAATFIRLDQILQHDHLRFPGK